MLELTTNLSDSLLELIKEDQVPIDGVEVGPWFSVRQIRAYRKVLPDLPFYFHGGDLIERVGLIPGTVSRISGYLAFTGSPWVSMHITMWLPGMVWLMLRTGRRMPLPNPQRATRRFIRRVQRLGRAISVPVTLENVEPLPFAGYDFEVQTARVSQVFERTGCGFVLDTGHARVSAGVLETDVYDYVSHLPLERVVQVHVSGPRERDGQLVDAHEPLLEIDYTLLDYLLTRTRPRVVTLEYTRERVALREQLHTLREILNAHHAKA